MSKLVLRNIIIVWCFIVVIIGTIAVTNHYKAQRVLSWQGERYVFQNDYASELPEDAELLGKTIHKPYRSLVKEDLHCNLEEIDPDGILIQEDDECGSVYYSESKDCIFVAVYTGPNHPKDQKYFLFH